MNCAVRDNQKLTRSLTFVTAVQHFHKLKDRDKSLELASSYVLYGQRLGLLEESPNPDSLRFIRAVETMIKTTLPLLFLPTKLMHLTDAHIWKEHLKSWDIIFEQADKCIQNIYQEFCLGQGRSYSGIMAELLLQSELPLDSIKANITELMAGGVDTVSVTACRGIVGKSSYHHYIKNKSSRGYSVTPSPGGVIYRITYRNAVYYDMS
ncbi:cytochrome P450 11B, mitochondrial-like [Pelobates cultripes]|uniref:Cytochrome P450 11B, mitochondrial-like n=1 Tax=Pelobates cultripes TaxID=61616 RepID=A0AAD1W6T9_PELCU|nr:cytochrome P450 11B, mitochondrial-like [Pelobates cultripes]